MNEENNSQVVESVIENAEENKQDIVTENTEGIQTESDSVTENAATATEPLDQTPKKAQRTKPFIVTFVLSCIGFVAYVISFSLFTSMVFNNDVDTAGEALGIIFGLIFFLLPVFAAGLWTIIFSFVSAFCKKKGIRIPSIVILLLTAISAAVVFGILFTR